MGILALTDRLPHGWQVLATILAVGGLFSIAWGLSIAGQLDLAASGLSFFVMTLLPRLGWAGRVSEFSGTLEIIRQMRSDWDRYMGRRGVLAHVVVALGLTIVWLVLRVITTWVLHIVTTPWTALGAGLLLAAVVASPLLIQAVTAPIRAQKGGDAGDDSDR